MGESQPTIVKLHLTNGCKHTLYQEDSDLVARICNDLDGQIFTRPTLIVDSGDHVTAFPGHSVVGICVTIDPLPLSFLVRERASSTVITQIAPETFESRRKLFMSKVEGKRSATLAAIQFVTGEELRLEFSEVALNGIAERSVMHHLFSRGPLFFRGLDGGFGIWNTAHIVSWSHYPRLEVPANAWEAHCLSEMRLSNLRKML